jgi:hypothetical protein
VLVASLIALTRGFVPGRGVRLARVVSVGAGTGAATKKPESPLVDRVSLTAQCGIAGTENAGSDCDVTLERRLTTSCFAASQRIATDSRRRLAFELMSLCAHAEQSYTVVQEGSIIDAGKTNK